MRNSASSRDPFARRNRRPRSYGRTLTSALALATILAMPARETFAANGFDANFTPGAGFSVEEGLAGQTITVSAQTAIIDWQPNDTMGGGGAFDFMTQGSVTYQAGSPGGEYTVLNRINSTKRMDFTGGSITSDAGGGIWFYAPGGMLFGSGVSVNVGGLFLTSADPHFITDGAGFVSGFTSDRAIAGTAVEIDGASITAQNYFGILAPRIVQSGDATVTDGSAAYIAAEQADLTFTGDLFDITVPLDGGSDVADAITHSGSTSVTADSAGQKSGIYLVAVPRNVAMTMLLGGGTFENNVAGEAVMTDQGVVLTSGRNIADGTAGQIGDVGGVSEGVAALNPLVTIDGGNFNTESSGRVFVRSGTNLVVSGGDFGGNTDIFTGGRNLTIDTSGGSTSFSAGAQLDSSGFATEGTAKGGDISLSATSGNTLTVNGPLTINSSATSDSFGDAVAGDVNITADGSSALISINNGLVIDASGHGGNIPEGDAPAGAGTGGHVVISGLASGDVQVFNGVDVNADGFGGDALGGQGGVGTSGSIAIFANIAGSVETSGLLSAHATGVGGNGAQGGDGVSLIGFDTIPDAINIQAVSGSVAHSGTALLYADAEGGQGADGASGSATAGRITFFGNNGSVGFTDGSITANANAYLGSQNARGGSATGGQIHIVGGGFGNVSMGDVTVSAYGNGGDSFGASTVAAGTGTGGQLTISASSATSIKINSLGATLTGTGGRADSGTAGSGTGGSATISADASDAHVQFADSISITADGTGGTGRSGEGGVGNGGAGFGGDILVSTTSAGQVTFDNGIIVSASGFGGEGGSTAGDGGAARGGTVRLQAVSGTISAVAQEVRLVANATGGDSATGNGGAAFSVLPRDSATPKGYIELAATGGTIRIGDDDHSPEISFRADSAGGFAGTSGASGNADAGAIAFMVTASGAIDTYGFVNILAGATISPTIDGPSVNGGNATGGDLLIRLEDQDSSLRFRRESFVSLSSTGGDNGVGGAAGTGLGGTAVVEALAGTTATFDGALDIEAIGSGGGSSSGTGGKGTGGDLLVGGGGGHFKFNEAETGEGLRSVTLQANGLGGNGKLEGGIGQGGSAVLGTQSVGGTIYVAGDALVAAFGGGGYAGSQYYPQSGALASIGGVGYGGTAGFEVIGGTMTIEKMATADASGFGGSGRTGGAGYGGGIDSSTNGAFAVAVAGNIVFNGDQQGSSISGLNLYAPGFGGAAYIDDAGNVGAGGAGYGGFAGLSAFTNGNDVQPSRIDAVSVYALAVGYGADGLASSSTGIAGGHGGDGQGGTIRVSAHSESGVLVLGKVTVDASGVGGDGGAGFSAFGEPTVADGGAAGSAIGGFVQIGTISGPAPAINNGSVTIGELTALASGSGGVGGAGANGNIAEDPNGGNGGLGGNGSGGLIGLDALGAPVMVDSVNLFARGLSGGGGNGGTADGSGSNGDAGFGGVGTGGRITVLTGAHADNPANLGTLTVSATLLADASGAFGEGNGGSTVAGSFVLSNGDLSLADTVFTNAFGGTINVQGTTTLLATGQFPGSVPSEISVGDSTIIFGGDLTVSTTGPNSFAFFSDSPTGSIAFGGSCTINGVAGCPIEIPLRGPPEELPLDFGTSTVPAGRVDVPYEPTQLIVTGGTAPYIFTPSASTPPGVTVSSTGLVSGTPTQSGSYSFKVTVTDSSSPTPRTAEMEFTIEVAPPQVSPPPPVVSPPPPVVSPPPPVVSPPPPVVSPPPPVVSPPPPVVSPPPPVVSPPPPVVSPPPPVVSPPPPPPPPPANDPTVIAVVNRETTIITSAILDVLDGSRIAGGGLAGDFELDAAGSSADDSGDLASDDSGDDESAETGTAPSGNAGGGNSLIDMRALEAPGTQIDTPITSSGNSSLWSGSDGLGDAPGDSSGAGPGNAPAGDTIGTGGPLGDAPRNTPGGDQ